MASAFSFKVVSGMPMAIISTHQGGRVWQLLEPWSATLEQVIRSYQHSGTRDVVGGARASENDDLHVGAGNQKIKVRVHE